MRMRKSGMHRRRLTRLRDSLRRQQTRQRAAHRMWVNLRMPVPQIGQVISPDGLASAR